MWVQFPVDKGFYVSSLIDSYFILEWKKPNIVIGLAFCFLSFHFFFFSSRNTKLAPRNILTSLEIFLKNNSYAQQDVTKLRFFFSPNGYDDYRLSHSHLQTRAESSQDLSCAYWHHLGGLKGSQRTPWRESLNLLVPLGLFQEHLIDLN